jgi:predicted nuclease with RNAse H fold
MGLKREIGSRGVNVIEVYPYAAKVALFGRSIPSKMRLTGVSFLRDRLVELMPQLVPHVTRFNHDLCDALVAAYTAYLYTRGEVELLGDPDEGAICVPASEGVAPPLQGSILGLK